MYPLKSVKILICTLVFLLLAKPLVAFNMYKRVSNTTNQASHFLLLRLIKKRKEGEYTEDAVAEITSVEQKIAAPVFKLLLRYASFIALFLGIGFLSFLRKVEYHLKSTFFQVVPDNHFFLLVGKLSI